MERGPDRIVAVATSALREAANRPAIEERLAEAVPCGVRYLSGTDEATLAFSAILAAGDVGPPPVLGADLGGGSLDIAAGRGAKAEWTATLPLGVGRLAGTMRDDPPARSERESMHHRIERELKAVDPPLPEWLAVPSCAAAGGTARAIGRMVEATRKGGSSRRLTRVSAEELDALAARLWSLSARDRRALPSIDHRRADYLPMGAAVLAGLCWRVGSGTLTISPWGLREGLVLEVIRGEWAIPRSNANSVPRSGEPIRLPA